MTTPNASFTGTTEPRPPDEQHAHAVLDDDGNPWRPDDDEGSSNGWRDQLGAMFESATTTVRNNPLAAMGIALAAGFIVGRIRAARS